MQALVWTAPSQMEMQNLPRPEAGPGELLIKVAYAGICGSELGGYLGHNSLRVPPLIMGHEFSGEVVALGAGVGADFPQFRVGQAVTVNPLACDPTSPWIGRGLAQLCPTRRLVGAHRPGAYAEYLTVPAQSAYPLPASLSLRLGALAEPVGCAVRIGEIAGDVQGQNILIIGAGPIGLLALQVLLGGGAANVIIADLEPARLAMAAELGGQTIDPQATDVVAFAREASGAEGVDLAVDAVGATSTRAQCVAATRPSGTVILSGLHEESSPLPAADIIRREIVLRGSFAYSPANFQQAITLLAEEAIRLDPWIVEAPLAEGGPWFERLIHEPGNVAKVLLVP
jgi:threonine dehydrogenase-like Zn-dependent dehydrogenase